MTNTEPSLGQLLERHAAGEAVDVPAAFAAEFEQALAADAMLRRFLDPTEIAHHEPLEQRDPPQLPPDYSIERELGHGGMGVVYLARQHSLHREVAIKVLRPSHQAFRNLVDRFLHEAQHLAKLRHPHIVTIHEIGDAGGEPYFTMDYVDGEPLTQRLSHGPLSPTQAVELLKQVASAVQHAHKHGIVHRDLKPANILLNHQGQAFVTDFGLARQMQQDSTLTQTGEVLGTPQYMAPEQARGESSLVGEATDIHALGLILYEMLTGRPAFHARSPADVLVKLLHQEPDPPRRLDHRVPRDLETICLKCLQKEPAARYANVGALLEDIRRYEAGEPLTARRPGVFSTTIRWCRRHWKIAATACLAATLALLLASMWFDRSYDDLVAWGDEELATGNTNIASQVYFRAWAKGTESQQRELIDRILQVSRMSDQPVETLDLALKVIELDPTVSFGMLDHLIAQALVARERALYPNGAIDIWHSQPRASLELIRQRLELALEHGVPDEMRLETLETLTAVKLVLGEGTPDVRYAPDFLYHLPTGSDNQLQAMVDDESQPMWNRGKAAIALGRQLEQRRDPQQALQKYEVALEFLRKVYPYSDGVRSRLSSSTGPAATSDAEECQLVAGLIADLMRLAPEKHKVSTGRIEVSLEGEPLPDDVTLALGVELSDRTISQLDEGLPHRLPRLVQLDQSGNATVEVLKGRYRLRATGHQSQWGSSSERFMRLMQIDTDHWPKEVMIGDDRLELPPARIRLADEVRLLSPEQAEPLNLNEAVFRWRPVPNAAYYLVQLLYSTESPHPTSTFFAFIRAEEPQLHLSKLESADRKAIAENLLTGRTGGWSVVAYDANERRVGISLEERRFLVAEQLSNE